MFRLHGSAQSMHKDKYDPAQTLTTHCRLPHATLPDVYDVIRSNILFMAVKSSQIVDRADIAAGAVALGGPTTVKLMSCGS